MKSNDDRMNNTMIDKAEISCRFRKSVDSYDDHAVVQRLMIDKLCGLLKKNRIVYPDKILEIGCGTGLLTSALQRMFCASDLSINDLVYEMCNKTAERCGISVSRCLVGDIESFGLTEEYNLIASGSTFQWFTRPAETLKKLSAHLVSGGYLVFSTFGHENLKELRAVTGKGLVYHPAEELTAFLSPYFDVLCTEEDFHPLYFRHPVEILRHLKNTGVNATAAPQMWTKGRMTQFVEDYTFLSSLDKGYPLTYHSLYFVCRKKEL